MNASASAASARQRHARLPVQSDFFNEDDVMDDQAPPSDGESDDVLDAGASDSEPDEVSPTPACTSEHQSSVTQLRRAVA